MAGILSAFGRRHEPMPRAWHTSWKTGSKMLVHGGRTKDYSEKTKKRLASVVEVFDTYTELWQQKEVTGETPQPGVYLTAHASVDEDLFTFGGFDGSRFYKSLHKLKSSSHWTELRPRNEKAQSPIAKIGAGMVAFCDNLAVFGGYGIPHRTTQPGSSFIRSAGFTDGRGWTNEFHIYSLKDDVWTSPDITGERPPPCAHFTLTSIDNRRAVLFGGKNGEHGKMSDVYIIDLLTMHWTKLSRSGSGPWPDDRSSHAACCLNYNEQHPQLLITGGKNRWGKILEDAWILDVDSGKWRKVCGKLQPHWGHSITAFSLIEGVTEVTMFGGSSNPQAGSEEKSKLADTTLLQLYCSSPSEWELLSVTKSSKLGSEERVTSKKILKEVQERHEKRAQIAEERMQQAEQQNQGIEERVQQAEARAIELQKRLDEERKERERLAFQLEERERALQQAEERVKQAEEMIEQERYRVQVIEEKVQQVYQAEKQEQQNVQDIGLKLDVVEQSEKQRIMLHKQEGGSILQAEERTQQAGDGAEFGDKNVQQGRDLVEHERRPHSVEWQMQQAELLIEVAEARATSLRWRLGMVEGREQKMMAMEQLKTEIQQSGERALQTQKELYRAEERVQQERDMTSLTKWRVQQANFLAQLAETRATSLQWRLDMVEVREQERLAVQERKKELEHIEKQIQQAEERVQKAEERVQREMKWEQERERAHLTEERARHAEARFEELQRRLEEAERKQQDRLKVPEPAIIAQHKTVPIRGADILAKTTMEVVPGMPLAYHWMGHGLKLHIPAGALKPGNSNVTMTIQASLSGQYQLPDDTELVSGVYWVTFPRRFSQPVTMELQHCAYLEHPDQLSPLFFLTAKCNQKTLPYQFQPLPGGRFFTNSCYGAIELSHFSGYGVGRRKKKRKRYVGQIFYIPQAAITTWLVHFTIICDLELYLKKVESFYSSKGAETGPYLEVNFDGEEVCLDIPEDGVILPSGWSLLPLTYPIRLLQESVDSYKPGHTIPSCQIELDWVKSDKQPEKLDYKLHLIGMSPSGAFIRITRKPTLSESTQEVVTSTPQRVGTSIISTSAGDPKEYRTSIDAMPHFLQLHVLKSGSGKEIKVKESVCTHWVSVATQLSFSQGLIDIIRTENDGPEKAFDDMMKRWLNGTKGTRKPLSWRTLLTVLQDIDHGVLASDLESILSEVSSSEN